MTAFKPQIPMPANLILAFFPPMAEPQGGNKTPNAKAADFSGLLDRLVESLESDAPLPQGTLLNAYTVPRSGPSGLPTNSALLSNGTAKTPGDDGNATETAGAAAAAQTASTTATQVTQAAPPLAVPSDTAIYQAFPVGQARDGLGRLASTLSPVAKAKRASLPNQSASSLESGPNLSAYVPISVPAPSTSPAIQVHPGTGYSQTDNLPPHEPPDCTSEARLPDGPSVPTPTAGACVENRAVSGQPQPAGQASQSQRTADRSLSMAVLQAGKVVQPPMGSLMGADSPSPAGATGTSKPGAELARPEHRPNQSLSQPVANLPQPARPQAQPNVAAHNELPTSPLTVEAPVNQPEDVTGWNPQPDRQSSASQANVDATPSAGSSGAVPEPPPAALAAPTSAIAPNMSPAPSLAFSARLTPLFPLANKSVAVEVQTQSANAVAVRPPEGQGSRAGAPRMAAAAIAVPRDGATGRAPVLAPGAATTDFDANPEGVRTPEKPPAVDDSNREAHLSAVAASAQTVPGSGDSSPANASEPAAPAGQPTPQTAKGAFTSAPDKQDQPPVAKTADTPSDQAPQVAPPSSVAGVPRAIGEAPSATPASGAPDAEALPPAQSLAESRLKPAGAARGIQLQMNAGDEHVEIRVTDRAGELKVDVRTPNSRLAGALRADLPELAARIEQAGYRAETWQPLSSTTPDRWRPAESGASSQNMQDESQRQGGQQQNEGRRQDSEDGEQAAQRKQDRKDFRWLFNSIR